jgi:FKBP-type peptidyl-prolyl cis-trans isomerase FkpA
MNKRIIISLVLLALGFCSFGQTEGYRQNENDLYFKFYVKNDGKTAVIGDLASLHMIIKTEEGTVIKSSYDEKEGKPILFPVKVPAFPGDIYEAVAMMAAGDSASFLIPSDSIYTKVFRKPLPTNVKSGSLLNFIIKVQWIKAQPDLVINEHAVEVDRTQLANEEIEMHKYMTAQGLEMKKTKSGVYVEATKEGQGDIAVAKKMISFNYTGKFLDGKVFETTIKENGIGHPLSITVGNQQVIRGWEEAFLEMRAGGTYVVIVPSHMAFGPKGRGGVVPPNTPLVFEIQVVSVR